MEKLEGRGAVIIGTGGVGRGIALGLGREGMRVGVADIDRGTAQAVTDEIAQNGGTAVAMQVDATDTESLGALAQHAVDELGGVSLLVSTVGVITDRRLEDA